ncbi:MAG: PAS domain S-box protein [Deltaproteobacteria bacterium]|nr:PAS domain S-box protein [Deltaproteobacteria bacterium]
MALALSAPRGWDELPRLALQVALTLSGMDGGALYVKDERGDFTLVHAHGLSPRFVELAARFGHPSEKAALVRRGLPLFMNYDEIEAHVQAVRDEGLRSLGLVPALWEGEVLGFLALASHSEETVSTEVRDGLALLAGQIGRDLAHQRERNQRLLVESNLDTFFHAALDFFYVLDLTGRILQVNRALAEAVGLPAEQLVGRQLGSLYPDRSLEELTQAWADMSFEDWHACPFPLRTGDRTLHLETRLTQGQWNGVPAIFGVSRDVTDKVEAAERLRESEARYRSMFEHPFVVKLLIEPSTGRIVAANEAACRFYGYPREELERMAIYQINTLNQRAIDEELQAVVSGTRDFFAFSHRLASGEVREVEVYAGTIRVSGGPLVFSVIHDVTARNRAWARERQVERQHLKAQKLESLGVLAGGIAHDFNNLLVGVLGNASLLSEVLPPDCDHRALVEEIEASAERAAGLVRQLLAYAGRGAMRMEPIDLHALLRDMTPLLQASLSKRATLTIRAPSDAPLIRGDGSQIRQVILNLVVNASEALERGPGEITIALERTALSTAAAGEADGALPPGDYAALTVTDNGVGMSPLVRERLFEPFFSTKALGRGMGMPAVLGILREHGGGIQLSSEQESGTSIRLIFPALPAYS